MPVCAALELYSVHLFQDKSLNASISSVNIFGARANKTKQRCQIVEDLASNYSRAD